MERIKNSPIIHYFLGSLCSMAESSLHVHFWLSSFHDKYGVINDRHFLWECCRSWTNFIHFSLALQVSYEDILVSLFSMYQLSHLSWRNALCMSMAICISTMSCCVLRSLPFSKTCEKVFEMSLSKGFNIHSMFANVRYKFYCPKQRRIYLMKTIRGVLEEISISVSRHVLTVLWISALNNSYLIAFRFSFFLHIQTGFFY